MLDVLTVSALTSPSASFAALPDGDLDGIPDSLEVVGGTNPANADTDSDTLEDGVERARARSAPFPSPFDVNSELGSQWTISIGDLDGDALPELAIRNNAGLYVLRFDRLTGFAAITESLSLHSADFSVGHLVMADFDRDGDLDLASDGRSFLGLVENEDGRGQFGPPQRIGGGFRNGGLLTTADLNGDEYPDLIVHDSNAKTFSLLENLDGEGTFGDAQLIADWVHDGRHSIGLGDVDVDCDGDLDLFATGVEEFAWFENLDGEPLFGEAQTTLVIGSQWPTRFVADPDGDGDADLVRGITEDSMLAWLENDGEGTFSNHGTVTESGTLSAFTAAATADWNVDGNLDVFLHQGFPRGGVRLSLNPGTDPTESDTDRDGLDDSDEVKEGTNPHDPDEDGLEDAFEVRSGFNPLVAGEESLDSDGDGASNLEEQTAGTDPVLVDMDGDGLGDAEERDFFGTDPTVRDSDGDGLEDGDGLLDGFEVSAGFDAVLNDDRLGDQDADGLSNEAEQGLGTDPLNPDTDGDALTYELFVCENEAFVGCDPIVLAARNFIAHYAGVTGPFQAFGLLMILMGFRPLRQRPLHRSPHSRRLALSVFLLACFMSACSDGGGSGDSAPQMTQTVSGLAANTTFYWKVIASDGEYVAESDVRTFTTP